MFELIIYAPVNIFSVLSGPSRIRSGEFKNEKFHSKIVQICKADFLYNVSKGFLVEPMLFRPTVIKLTVS